MRKLSIVIPVYNEEKTLEEIVHQVLAVPLPSMDREVILVDDCSRDGTARIMQELREKHPESINVQRHDTNRGKGAALQTGFQHATGDIVIVQDADLEYDPQDYPLLIGPILANKADVVYGSRFMGGAPHRVLYFWHRVGNAFLTLVSNMFTNLDLTDMETCYKAFRGDVIRRIQLKENGFGCEPEMTAKVARLGCRVYEVGISYAGRTYAEGKKIGWRDGFRALWCIVRYS